MFLWVLTTLNWWFIRLHYVHVVPTASPWERKYNIEEGTTYLERYIWANSLEQVKNQTYQSTKEKYIAVKRKLKCDQSLSFTKQTKDFCLNFGETYSQKMNKCYIILSSITLVFHVPITMICMFAVTALSTHFFFPWQIKL